MGTSSKWPGPKTGEWKKVTRSVAQLRPAPGVAVSAVTIPGPRSPGEHWISEESAAGRGQRCRDALTAAVREDPEAYGLRSSMTRVGNSLIAVVEGFGTAGQAIDLEPAPDWPGARADWFLHQFVSTVAGTGTTIADAVARRCSTACAEVILADPAAAAAIERGDIGWRFPRGLFCEIYQFFFADFVSEFVHAVIAEKVNLVVPGLVLADPSGQIADWVADQVMAVIPMPCAEKAAHPEDPRSVTELAREMLPGAVTTALGIPEAEAA